MVDVESGVVPKHTKLYMTSSMPEHMALHDKILADLMDLFSDKIHMPVKGNKAQKLSKK